MKKSLLLLLGLCTAGAVSAQSDNKAGTRFYVQPSVVIAVPGDFDVAAGGALALGVNFLTNHSVEAEVIAFKTEDDHGSVKLDMVPLLLSYKYRIPLSSNFSLYGGASVGASLQKVQARGYYGGGEGETKSSATYGIIGGLRYAFNDRLSLDTGVKILNLKETSYTTEGSIELIHVGLTIQF